MPAPTPISLTQRNPTDLELFAFLFPEIEKEAGEGFYDHFPAGRWLRWNEDLDGDGEAEIVVAATDRWAHTWFTILRWEGDGGYERALEQVTPSQYFADISATSEDANQDGRPEIVVDSLTYGGGAGVVSVWWNRALARCAEGECAVIWSDDLLAASTSYQPDIGSADLSVRRCEASFAGADAEARPALVETCTGFEYYAFAEGRGGLSGSTSAATSSPFPYPFRAEKVIAPTEEREFDWNGQTYSLARSVERAPGQVISREFSQRAQQARSLVDEAVAETLQAQGLSTTGEAFWAAVERSWGLGDGEEVALAAPGDLGPPEGPEVVGVISGDQGEVCRLVVLTHEPSEPYAPAGAAALPCETNFARLEPLDLDGDGRDEILFHTLAVSGTQPILHDHLTIWTWSGSGLNLLFEGRGAFPDGFRRGLSASDLDGDSVYEIVQHLPAFDLEVGLTPRESVAWPSLDRRYDLYRWDAAAGEYRFWQTQRELHDQPGVFEIVEEAAP